MKKTSLKQCLKASENLLKAIDNADHSSWCWKEMGIALDEAEKLKGRQIRFLLC